MKVKTIAGRESFTSSLKSVGLLGYAAERGVAVERGLEEGRRGSEVEELFVDSPRAILEVVDFAAELPESFRVTRS